MLWQLTPAEKMPCANNFKNAFAGFYFRGLFTYAKDCRRVAEVGNLLLSPFLHAHSSDVFVAAGYAGCDAKFCRRGKGFQQHRNELAVAVGRFDERLCLIFF